MIPKMSACLEAVEAGVEKAAIIDGRIPHSILLEIFTSDGIGTEVVAWHTIPESRRRWNDALRRRDDGLRAAARRPMLVRGEGCYVWDAEGNRYLDFLAGHRRQFARATRIRCWWMP